MSEQFLHWAERLDLSYTCFDLSIVDIKIYNLRRHRDGCYAVGKEITEICLNACVENRRYVSGDMNMNKSLPSLLHTVVWFVGKRSDPVAPKLFYFTLLLLTSDSSFREFSRVNTLLLAIQPEADPTTVSKNWVQSRQLKNPGFRNNVRQGMQTMCSSIIKLIAIKVIFLPFCK